VSSYVIHNNTRVNQKVNAIFKLPGNRDIEELAHCAVLTVPVEEFSHAQYSALPSVEWQQRGRKHGRSFARLHQRRTTWPSAVSFGSKGVKPVEIHRRMLAQYGQSTVSQRKVYEWVERFKSGFEHVLLIKVFLVGQQHRAAEKLLLRRNTETS